MFNYEKNRTGEKQIMDPITIALGLAKLVPWIAGQLAGEKAQETAETVVRVAQAVTGIEDPEEAARKVAGDRGELLKFETALNEWRLQMAREDTARLIEINRTMQAEGQADDPWRRRWRPYWGFVSGTAFGIQIFGLMFIMGWAVIAEPAESAVIIERLAGLASSLMTTWALALAVLGVAVWKRSEDKQTQAGLNPKGILDSLRGK